MQAKVKNQPTKSRYIEKDAMQYYPRFFFFFYTSKAKDIIACISSFVFGFLGLVFVVVCIIRYTEHTNAEQSEAIIHFHESYSRTKEF